MKSIGAKLAVIFGVLLLVFSAAAVLRTWLISRAHARQLTGRQAALALEFDLAIRKYVAEEVRPEIQKRVAADEFIPEVMSTTFVARSVFEQVRRKFPGAILKFSSDNPRNPANQAGPEERKIIEYFNGNPDAERWVGEVHLGNRLYHALAVTATRPTRRLPSWPGTGRRPASTGLSARSLRWTRLRSPWTGSTRPSPPR